MNFPTNCPECNAPGTFDRGNVDYECGSQNNLPGIMGVPEGFCRSKACIRIGELERKLAEETAKGDYVLDEGVSLLFLETRQVTMMEHLLDRHSLHMYRYPYGPQKIVDIEDDGSVTRSAHPLLMLGIGRRNG